MWYNKFEMKFLKNLCYTHKRWKNEARELTGGNSIPICHQYKRTSKMWEFDENLAAVLNR